MKSVLISIKPKWVEKITSGEKTIEVRKTAPKEVPFKAYIYMTKEKPYMLTFAGNGKMRVHNGTVIGEFICDEVEAFHEWELSPQGKFAEFEEERLEKFLSATCLSIDEIVRYRENLPYYKPLYGWHISDLKIYDKPKELSKFNTPPCEKSERACGNCKWLVKRNTPDVYECECYVEDGRPITRPPQSYMFVEEVEE